MCIKNKLKIEGMPTKFLFEVFGGIKIKLLQLPVISEVGRWYL